MDPPQDRLPIELPPLKPRTAWRYIVILFSGLLGLGIGFATGERYGRREANDWMGHVIVSAPNDGHAICIDHGKSWSAGDDGVCRSDDRPK